MPCPAPKVGGALFAVQACPDQAAGERHGYKADLALRASGYKAVLVLENCLGIVILLTVVERSGFVKYYCPVLVAEAKVEEPRIAGRRTGAKRSSAKPNPASAGGKTMTTCPAFLEKSGKLINYTVRIALNPTPKKGCDSFSRIIL